VLRLKLSPPKHLISAAYYTHQFSWQRQAGIYRREMSSN